MEILQKSGKISENSETVVFDCYDWSKDIKIDLDNLFERAIKKGDGKGLGTPAKKSSLTNQIFDVLRENGGYRLALNNLLFITTKYKSLFDHL